MQEKKIDFSTFFRADSEFELIFQDLKYFANLNQKQSAVFEWLRYLTVDRSGAVREQMIEDDENKDDCSY